MTYFFLGYAFVKYPSFTFSRSVWESLILSDHACTWTHMFFIHLRVGDMALFLPLTLGTIVIHVVAAGVTLLYLWERLMYIGVFSIGATLLAALVTGRMLVVCVGDMSPILLMMIAAVISAAASFSLPFVRIVTLMCLISRPLLGWLGGLYRLWWWYWHRGWGGREICLFCHIIRHLLFLLSHHWWSSHLKLGETAL